MTRSGQAGLLRRLCPACREGLELTGWVLQDRMFPIAGDFRWLQCHTCGTLVLENPPEDLESHYPPDRYYSYQERPSVRREPFTPLLSTLGLASDHLEDWLQRCFPQKARVLDIGCGHGDVLDLYRRMGWQTWGIELSSNATRNAEQKGHRILPGPFPSSLAATISGYRNHFDLVRLRHVLEHLPDPRATLRVVYRLLRSKGRCLIEIPNISGWLSRLLGCDYWQLDPPRHLVLPSRTALASLLREEGFRLEGWRSLSRPEGFAKSVTFALRRRLRLEPWYLSSSHRPQGYRHLLRFGRVFSALADRQDQGDSLQLVAQRKDTP